MKHIVLIEDDPDDVYFFRETLKKHSIDARLTVVPTGEKFIEYIENVNDTDDTIFLLDLNLPGISGLEVLAQVNKKDVFKDLIIIIYSTSTYEKDINQAYNLGAKSYFKKSSSSQELTSLISLISDYWFKYCELPRKK